MSTTRRSPGAKTVTVAGGNLFRYAAQHLGDATRWDEIAALSGLDDPWIVGTVTLTIPVGRRSGGILNVRRPGTPQP